MGAAGFEPAVSARSRTERTRPACGKQSTSQPDNSEQRAQALLRGLGDALRIGVDVASRLPK